MNRSQRSLRCRSLAAAAVLTLAVCAPAPLLAQQANQPAPVPALGTQGIEAYVSNKAMQALYSRRMDTGEFGVNDVRGGFFINENRDVILVGDLLVDIGRPEQRPNWALNVGPRVYGALLTGLQNDDVFAIGFGGKLSYLLGRGRETSVSLTAFYAPNIITFGSADNVKDATLQFETQLTAATRIFVGYRVFEFEQSPGERKVDDGAHIGVAYRF